MKQKTLFKIVSLTIVIYFILACHKETDKPGGGGSTPPDNKPPVANAGPDQNLVYPYNSTILDGSNSTDPDNNIDSYQWRKILGPASLYISEPDKAVTDVKQLEYGRVYQLELKVTDTRGLYSKDTVEVRLEAARDTVIFDNLFWDDDPVNRWARTQSLILPGGYSVNNIKKVWVFTAPFPNWNSYWIEIQKDGHNVNEIYYKIESANNSLFAYWYYDTPPGYVELFFAPYKMMIEFQ